MAPLLGLTIVKRFTYRGDTSEEFSNTYHFKQAPPTNAAGWDVIRDGVVQVEQNIFNVEVAFVRVYGYDSDDPKAHHVYSHDYTVPGPPPTGLFVAQTGSTRMAGDQAACVWWKLDYLSDKGKPVYLRKYFHAGFLPTAAGDALETKYEAALAQLAGTTGMNAHYGGLTNGPNEEGEARKDGTVVVGGVIPWVTTRTLKRRGKRPKAAA